MTHARIPDFSQPVPVRRPQPGAAGQRPPVDRRYRNLPDEIQPGTLEPWEAVTPVRPDTAHSRALRFLNVTGEALTAVAIIAGGVFAYGYMPPL